MYNVSRCYKTVYLPFPSHTLYIYAIKVQIQIQAVAASALSLRRQRFRAKRCRIFGNVRDEKAVPSNWPPSAYKALPI